MANKTYSPREAAIEVLKRAEELYKESSLAKAETGHEKGVHTAANFQVNRPGVSHAGISTRSVGINESKGGGQDWQGRNEAKDRQKKVLNEMKAMPKPNLGKAEPTASPSPSPAPASSTEEYDPYTDPGIVNKSEEKPMKGSYKLAKFVGRMGAKRGVAKGETGHEKGVHTSMSQEMTPGMSQAGNKARPWNDSQGPIKGTTVDKEGSAQAHKQVLGEMKQIKPKLPG